MKWAKTYILRVEIDTGCDEFWEDVAKGKARTKVRDEIMSCLADHGFYPNSSLVKIEDVVPIKRRKRWP